ncbi:hypothetical protein ACM66B_004682 [Microbotryomycetes sp. NB124-2]
MASSAQTALEGSLKSTIHALSLLVSQHATIDSLGVSAYVQHAPRQLVNQLQQETTKFDGLCTQLEQQILRAIAVLERDALKAAGLPLPRAPQTAANSPTATKDGQDDVMDDAFFNSSLFGDTPANSRPTTSSGQPMTLTGPSTATALDGAGQAQAGNALGLSLPVASTSLSASASTSVPTSVAPPSAPFATGGNVTTAHTSNSDVSSILGAAPSASNSTTQPMLSTGEVDINALLSGTLTSLSSNDAFSSSIGDADMQAMLKMIAEANVPPPPPPPSQASTAQTTSTKQQDGNGLAVGSDIDLSNLLSWSSSSTTTTSQPTTSFNVQAPSDGLGSIDFSTFDFSSTENLDELLNSFSNSSNNNNSS